MKGKLDRNQRKGLVESKKRQKQPTNWERADLTQIGPMLGEVGNHDLKQMRNSTVSVSTLPSADSVTKNDILGS